MKTKPLAIKIATLTRKIKETEDVTAKKTLKTKLAVLKKQLSESKEDTNIKSENLSKAKIQVDKMTKKDFNEYIKKLSKNEDYKFLGLMTKEEIVDDIKEVAKPVGWRFKGNNNRVPSKKQVTLGRKSGDVYYENRSNHSDVSRVVRLEKGGGVEEIEPMGWKHKDAVEYGKKLLNKGAKHIEIRNKLEEHYPGLKSEMQNVINDILDYKESKMANGGGVGSYTIEVGIFGDESEIKATWKKYGIKGSIKRDTSGQDDAILTGSKENLKKYLTSKEYGMRVDDAKEIFPELYANGGGVHTMPNGEVMLDSEHYAKGGNVVSIAKKVAEVNALIERANELGLKIVNENITWQSPMKYKPFKYSNGVLYEEYEELDLYKANRGKGVVWKTFKNKTLKANMQYDNPLNEVAKMYRKALKHYDTYGYANGGEMAKGGGVSSADKRVTESQYDDMMEVLPPIMFDTLDGEKLRGFAVDEPSDHKMIDGKMKEVYQGYYEVKEGGKTNYYAIGEYVYFDDKGKALRYEKGSASVSDEPSMAEIIEEIVDEKSIPESVVEQMIQEYGLDESNVKDWFDEHYEGEYNSDDDLAYGYVDMIGGLDALGKQTLESYFDYSAFGRDLANDFHEHEGHYFRYKNGGVMAKGGGVGKYAEGGSLRFIGMNSEMSEYELENLQGKGANRGVSIKEMNKILSERFPYSFGFTLRDAKSRDDLYFLKPNQDNPLKGIQDDSIRISFDSQHTMDFRIFQGGENTYFYFLLFGSDDKEYIGEFGFKDRGDVPKEYVTSFISFLCTMYGYPFKVSHNVYAKGGSFIGKQKNLDRNKNGKIDSEDLRMIRENKMATGGDVGSEIEELWQGYAEAVLFTEEEELGSDYTIYDFDEKTESSTKKMLATYYKNNKKAIEESELSLDVIGNDIWYTRSGQGAGFFDHSLDDEIEKQLIDGAKAMGEFPSVEIHNGKVSIRGGKVFAHGGSMGSNNKNGKYLDSISSDKKSKILKNIASHYGFSVGDAEEEVRDADAEMLYEYIANDQSLRMDVYNDMEKGKMAMGGGIDKRKTENWFVVVSPKNAFKEKRIEGYFLTEKEAKDFIVSESKIVRTETWVVEKAKKKSKMANGGEMRQSKDFVLKDKSTYQADGKWFATASKVYPKNRDKDAMSIKGEGYTKKEALDDLENNLSYYADGGEMEKGGGLHDDNLLSFTIPTWAVSSLVNGDDSGLEDEDIEKLNKFLDKTVSKYGNAFFMIGSDEDMESEFSYRNDIDGTLGGDVVKMYLRPERMAKGGEITPQLNTKVIERAGEIYKSNKGKTKSDFDKAFDEAIIEFGYKPSVYHERMMEIGSQYDDDLYAMGGNLGEPHRTNTK